jgi:hypothetical protein
MNVLLLLVGILVAPDSAVVESLRVVTVSPRVGPVIDAAERVRFHLLPGLPSFACAVFRQHADSSLTIEVTCNHSRGDTVETFPVSPEQFQRIGNYIDRYDEVVRELAALPDGAKQYQSLWHGIGSQPDSLQLAMRSGPTEGARERQVMGGIVGAACGLGVGSAAGALAGITFAETRLESIQVEPCLGNPYWERYVVDVYDLNQTTYGIAAGAGGAGGATAGWLMGRGGDGAQTRRMMRSQGIAGYDLFEDPIALSEVRNRMQTGNNRALLTFLGASGGWVAGVGAGLLITAVVRSIVFRPTPNDSIIVRNGGFALDLPLIAISLGSAVEGGYIGYRRGRVLDWEAGFKQAWRDHVQAALSQEQKQ